MEEKRDFWSKIEIFTKFFSGVIIALVIIIIGIGTNRIANSLSYGDLSQKLLADISLQDTSHLVKRDLSLIILNRTIGDDNVPMLAEIAEVVWKNGSTEKERNVAFKILKERDSDKAKAVLDAIKNNSLTAFNTDSTSRKNSISSPGANTEDTSSTIIQSDEITLKNSKILASAAVATIFIQTNKMTSLIDDLKKTLDKSGFLVPNVEIINKKYTNNVRYFNVDDGSIAKSLIDKVISINPNWKCELRQFKNLSNVVPKGQIEIWIYQK